MTFGKERHRREYFRLRLDPPLFADMTIVLIKGKSLEVGSAKVLIEDIGGGGLRFLSHLKMPANDQLVLQFETLLQDEPLKMYGHILRTAIWGEKFYEYAVRFTMEEAQHLEINRIVNRYVIRSRQNRQVRGEHFLQGDREQFLEEQARLSLQTTPAR
ncbi:PilZ domain-containing protein [Brevibacillus sp. GCM10020057]|uniref:PilZ domain-containing protein n=1 Tax=Brevibacillus sp. GCM10020057 TaxID=3317327 RepID=UPI00362650BF